jgi:hypothetical protein
MNKSLINLFGTSRVIKSNIFFFLIIKRKWSSKIGLFGKVKKKKKLSLWLLIKHYAMKTYGGVDV